VRRWGILLALSLAAAGSAWSGQRLERLAGERAVSNDLLYLPNGKYLKVASLGQESLLADLIYLWAIQYYSIYDREVRFRYVEHVFGNVIAELDPNYVDPYWMGALILSVEAHDLEAGLRLLDTGFEKNPRSWVLPYLAGWECYHAGQLERARTYFGKASRVPGAPSLVQRMEIGMLARLGDYRSAIRMWSELIEDPNSDDVSRAIAERQLRQLKTELELQLLRQALERFRKDNGRFLDRLAELVVRSYIRELPRDSAGRTYGYDPATGRVSAPTGRMLGESG